MFSANTIMSKYMLILYKDIIQNISWFSKIFFVQVKSFDHIHSNHAEIEVCTNIIPLVKYCCVEEQK